MQFRIVTFGAKQAAAHLTDIGNRAVDVRVPLTEIYLSILDIVEEIFAREGQYAGNDKWLELSTDHLRAKRKLGKDLRILRMDGDLHASVTQMNHPDQFKRIARDHIVFKSTRPFADVHFRGQRKKGIGSRTPGSAAFHRGVPARPFIAFSESDRRAFAREILRHLIKTKQIGPGT